MKGAIFDLDGTLTLTQQLHERAYASVFKKSGITYLASEDFYYAGIGSDYTFKHVFESHGVTNYDLARCKEEKKRVYEELLKHEEIKLVPGAKEFLEKLRKRKIPFAVASGNRIEFVKKILSSAAILDYFKVIITNNDVKHGKPDPEIFLTSSAKLGIAPRDCVVFEDAWSGISAAKKSGMYCVALETLVPRDFLKKAGADITVEDYFDPALDALFSS